MKVLFFTNHLNGGDGWSRSSQDVISPMMKRGVDCVCFVNKKSDGFPAPQKAILKEPLKYFIFPLFIIIDCIKICWFARKLKPDVVHIIVEPYAFFFPFLRVVLRSKFVLTVNGTYAVLGLKRWRTSALTRWYYKIVNQIIAISHYTAGRLLVELPRLHHKITVVPCGITHFPSRTKLDEESGRINNRILSIVFVGWISDRKGVAEAIEAMRAYKEQYDSNFLFTIVGPCDHRANYAANLKSMVNRYGLEKQIKFTGAVSEEQKEKILSEADIFIMLSKVGKTHFEGFGIVYLEANKYGVPVIGPNDGGPTDAIKYGYSGYTVNVFNSAEVAEKMHMIRSGSIKHEDCRAWAREHDAYLKTQMIYDIYNS